MNKINLSLIATVVPLVIVAIGLVGWILTLRTDVTSAVVQINVLQEEIMAIRETLVSEHVLITDLEKSLAIASDQMKTIMGDHEYMGEMLRELGETQPPGERREYGGY